MHGSRLEEMDSGVKFSDSRLSASLKTKWFLVR